MWKQSKTYNFIVDDIRIEVHCNLVFMLTKLQQSHHQTAFLQQHPTQLGNLLQNPQHEHHRPLCPSRPTQTQQNSQANLRCPPSHAIVTGSDKKKKKKKKKMQIQIEQLLHRQPADGVNLHIDPHSKLSPTQALRQSYSSYAPFRYGCCLLVASDPVKALTLESSNTCRPLNP
uniref:Uncharacterized protein n=1 Tax=Physcomitrium patens TaxID=3218 RepID=A0A2K1K3R2_PHYPA|nr:hypothetical protein PHYPA_012885 [Physcomitrium patens]